MINTLPIKTPKLPESFIQRNRPPLKFKLGLIFFNRVLNCLNLLRNNTQHLNIYPVELIKARPGAALRKPAEKPPHSFIIQPIRAIKHDAL